ncbi:MAG: CHASE4 domain-containing protein [Thermodesulfobacteriota bacterium]
MSLRAKTLWITGLAILGLALLTYTAAHWFMSAGFHQLEQDFTRRNLARASAALTHEISSLFVINKDWSNWDDSYRFVQDRNEDYLESNLVPETFLGLSLAALFFFDADGRMVYGQGFDSETEEVTPPPPGLMEHLGPSRLLSAAGNDGPGMAGLLPTADGLFLVSARPILTSQGKGPARGVLIMARALSGESIQAQSERTVLSLGLYEAGRPDLPPDVAGAVRDLSGGVKAVVRELGEDAIAGYTFVNDVYGRPGLVLRVRTSRPIHRQAQDTILKLVLVFLVTGVLGGGGVLLLLEKVILSRLARLTRDVEALTRRVDLSGRISLEGSDELAGLARKINDLLSALMLHEQRFRDVASSMADWVWETDARGVYTFCSGKVESILGYAPEEMVGRTPFDFMAPEEAVRVRDSFDQALAGAALIQDLENWKLSRDGRPVCLLSNGVPILDETGRPVGLRGVDKDITLRKLIEEELRRTRNYLNDLVDSMPSVLVAVDGEGRVTHWNVQAEKIIGRSRSEVLGRPLAEVFPLAAGRMDLIMDCLRKSEPAKVEKLPTALPDGKAYSDIMIYPLVADGAAGAVVRVDDVTARVRMEELVVQTEKMASVGALAAGMAHEINNPLSGILQGAQMVQRRLEVKGPRAKNLFDESGLTGLDLEKWRQYLERSGVLKFLAGIEESGLRAARIVKDLLEFSRERTISIEPHDLHEVIDRALNLALTDYDLRGRYDLKKMRMIKEYDQGLGLVLCDPPQIQQVVLNLVKNAAQALADQTQGAGFEPVIRITTRRKEGQAEMEVADNGPGLTEETRSRLFEPFFTTKPVGQGTGLGLYVSLGIVQKHHGTIEQGANALGENCFVVRLPLAVKNP